MKTLATLLLAMASLVAFGQKVYIPDAAFRAYIASVSPTAMTGDSMNINDPIITTLDSVNISNRGINNITGIFYFDSLHILEASFNNLSTTPQLPARIKQSDGRVNFSHNSFSQLLNSLELLSIYNLNLSYCNFSGYWDYSYYSQWRVLDLSHNHLDSMYISTPFMVNLNCSYNNLTRLSYYYSPSALRILNVSHNQFHNDSLLINLLVQVFDCSYNQLNSLPLLPSSVKQLNCSHNSLTNFATQNGALEVLNINNNKLSVIDMPPPALQELYCDSNDLIRISTLPTLLKKLSCRYNNLLCLPTLPYTLQTISATGNYIACYANIPTAPSFVSDILYNGSTYTTCANNDSMCYRYGVAKGYIYVDINNNNMYDAGDYPLANQSITTTPNGQIAVSNSQGYYTLPIYPGLTYTGIAANPAFKPDTNTFVVNQAADTAIVNYALHVASPFSDVAVYISEVMPSVPTDTVAYHVKIVNRGTRIEAGQVQLNIPQATSYVNSIPLANNTSLPNPFWSYSNLQPGAEATYMIWVKAGNSAVNSIYQVRANVTLANTDSLPLNNRDTVFGTFSASNYRRNRKSVLPTNYSVSNFNNNEYIDYTIIFQNTGNSTAANVWIIDTLSTRFDMSSLYVVGASHAYTLSITNNVLRVDFPNINLVDTSVNQVTSHGFFRFLIKPDVQQPFIGSIYNKAYIYFSNGLVDSSSAGVSVCISSLHISTTSTDICYFPCGIDSGYAGVDATTSGSTNSLGYRWSNGEQGSWFQTLTADEYFVTVSDGCGTTAVGSVLIVDSGFLSNRIFMRLSTAEDTCYKGTGMAWVTTCSNYGPVSWQWNNGSSADTIYGLYENDYVDVTASDNNGGITFMASSIPPPAYPLIDAHVVSDICNGAAVVDYIDGGDGSIYYQWSNGTTDYYTSDFDGTYSVTVGDGRGCIDVDTIDIHSLAMYDTAVVLETTATDCYGGLGQLHYIIPEGSYAVNEFNTEYLIGEGYISKPAGDYTYYIIPEYTYGNTCYFQKTIHIGVSAPIDIIVAELAPAGCNNMGGSLAVSVNLSGYSAYWSNGDIGDIAMNLAAGQYEVTVYNADNSCSATATGEVTQITSNMYVEAVSQNTSCFDSIDGQASLQIADAIEPYTIAWSNGETTSTISQLVAGSYGYTVTESTGCMLSGSVDIGEPTQLVVTTETFDAPCNSTGSASALVSGGTSPYIYGWSTGENTVSITSLSVGIYACIVTDANSCTAVASATINPIGLAINSSVTNVACYGAATGSITLSPSGTPPYTVTWSTGASGLIIDQLVAGAYSYTVSDDGGCTTSGTKTITQNDSITVTASVVDVTCYNAATGSIALSASGGSGNYSYLWNEFSTPTPILIQINAGTYTYTVIDSSNCQVVGNVTVSQPNDLYIQVTTVDASCSGGANGSATAVAIGGTPPYTYTWQSNINPSSLAPGAYIITVNDACNQESAHFSIGNGGFGISTFDVYNPTCHNYNDGGIEIYACGGTGNYTYTWSNGAQGYYVTDLGVGTYTVTISDGDNTVVKSMTLTEPDSISFDMDASCYGPAAEVYNEAGGTYGPYQYYWSNGQHTNTLNHVQNGIYQVTVSDYNGCSASSSINVVSAENLYEPFIDYMPNACSATGVVRLYKDNNDNLVTFNSQSVTYPQTIAPVQADHSYHLIISDSSFTCSKDTFIYIPDYDTLKLVLNTATNPACYGEASGSIAVGATGGTAPYTYLWNTGSTSGTINNAPAGDIICTVTDDYGCAATDTFTLTQPSAIVISATTTDATCHGTATGLIQLTVTGGTGNYTYQFSDPNIGNGPIPAGTYSATVTDANGCTLSTTQTINEPNAIVLNANITDITCFGTNDGAIALNVAGGITPYSYHWSNNTITPDNDNLAAGTHTVTITDASGCIITDSYIVADAVQDTYTITTDSASTCSASDGAINITMTSFINGPYAFAWSNSATGNNPTQLAVGTYTVTITNALGCTTTATATIDCATGIDNMAAVQIRIYPNPATSLVYINVPAGNNYTLSIHDVAGRLIKEQTLTQQLTELYLGDIAQGMYTVEVKTQQGISKVERLVVR